MSAGFHIHLNVGGDSSDKNMFGNDERQTDGDRETQHFWLVEQIGCVGQWTEVERKREKRWREKNKTTTWNINYQSVNIVCVTLLSWRRLF